MSEAFAGIDVACAKNKRLPIVVLVRGQDGKLEALRLRNSDLPLPPRSEGNVRTLDETWVTSFAENVDTYLRALEGHFGTRISRVAIDAPSKYCAPGLSRRRCEAALDASNISCIATPTEVVFEVAKTRVQAHLAAGGSEARLPHANQLWMLVGFALFRQLRTRYECLEVYPHAIVASLGAGRVHKSKQGGLLAQLEALNERTGWRLDRAGLARLGFGSLHDKLDACLSAWVASLSESERSPHGVPPGDVLWVPRGPAGA